MIIICRLAVYGNVSNPRTIFRSLRQLEVSYGGDGNGYYNFDTGRISRGLLISTAEIAFDTIDTDLPVIFHTRWASAGGAISPLNHPFDAGDYIVAHNGHWNSYRLYSRTGERSDTEVAARIVKEKGPGVLLDWSFSNSGVWLVAMKQTGQVIVILRGGRTFKFQWLEDGSYFHASESLEHADVTHSFFAKLSTVYLMKADGSVFTTELEPGEMPPMNNLYNTYNKDGAKSYVKTKGKVPTYKKRKNFNPDTTPAKVTTKTKEPVEGGLGKSTYYADEEQRRAHNEAMMENVNRETERTPHLPGPVV